MCECLPPPASRDLEESRRVEIAETDIDTDK